jgi:hypothetical protein
MAHSLFILGTHGPIAAHGTQSIHTWDSRSCCCSRHTAYTHLGLTALLSTICAIPSAIPTRTHSAPCSSFPSGRRTRAAFAHSHLCTLFLEHLCTPCLGNLCALCLENLCALSLDIVAHFLCLKRRCTLCLGSLRTLPWPSSRTLPWISAHFSLDCCALRLGSLRTLAWIVAHFTLDIVPDAPSSSAPPWLCGLERSSMVFHAPLVSL